MMPRWMRTYNWGDAYCDGKYVFSVMSEQYHRMPSPCREIEGDLRQGLTE